ncbi:riboflavin synthase [Haloarchaeobius amylolyticus]|uniref:riboflavin synthase n=1 Tax=Haloarchaeobius amylolyticus TaxID=1198296 RepID=UPI00226E117A
MYTGLVAGTGTVLAAGPEREGYRLRIETDGHVAPDPGDSVAVQGVCLTADRVGDGWFEAFCSETTLAKTTLGDLDPGDAVNLESPVGAGDALDGHLVRGCVETTTEVLGVESTGAGWRYTLAVPADFAGYLVTEGPITVDGVSLTVAESTADTVTIAVIPATAERTTLGDTRPGDTVNLEADPVAKYVARQEAVA